MPIKKSHIKKFEELAGQLTDLMLEITEYEPGANLYVTPRSFCLLVGESHDRNHRGSAGKSREDRIISSVRAFRTSGGDW